MAAKLQLVAAPTFKWPVNIPVAGEESAPVVFTFRHRTRSQFAEFQASVEGRRDIDVVMDMVVGWDLVDTFTTDNVDTLLENHMGAGTSIFEVYRQELLKHKAKN